VLSRYLPYILKVSQLKEIPHQFQGILQYGNMRIGEHYAQSAKISAQTMEEWTERMHDIAAKTEHETVSMHGITVLTMIFLPGTFVSVCTTPIQYWPAINTGTDALQQRHLGL